MGAFLVIKLTHLPYNIKIALQDNQGERKLYLRDYLLCEFDQMFRNETSFTIIHH